MAPSITSWGGAARVSAADSLTQSQSISCNVYATYHHYFCFEERQLHFPLIIDITRISETERKQASLVNLPPLQTWSPLLPVMFLLGSPASLTRYCLYNSRDLVPCSWKECLSFGGEIRAGTAGWRRHLKSFPGIPSLPWAVNLPSLVPTRSSRTDLFMGGAGRK